MRETIVYGTFDCYSDTRGKLFSLNLDPIGECAAQFYSPYGRPPSIRLRFCAPLSFSLFFSIRHRLNSALLSWWRLSPKTGFLQNTPRGNWWIRSFPAGTNRQSRGYPLEHPLSCCCSSTYYHGAHLRPRFPPIRRRYCCRSSPPHAQQ